MDYSGRKQQKAMLANKDSYSLYVLLYVFISQYSNKVYFISMGEAQMADQIGPVPI